MTFRKRLSAAFLAFLMAFSVVSTAVSAAGEGEKNKIEFIVRFFREKNGEWIPTERAKPGEELQARIYIKTDFATTSGEIALTVDSEYLEFSAYPEGRQTDMEDVANDNYAYDKLNLKTGFITWFRDVGKFTGRASHKLVELGRFENEPDFFDKHVILLTNLEFGVTTCQPFDLSIEKDDTANDEKYLDNWAVNLKVKVLDEGLPMRVNTEGDATVTKQLVDSKERCNNPDNPNSPLKLFTDFPRGTINVDRNICAPMALWEPEVETTPGTITTTSHIDLHGNGGSFASAGAGDSEISGIIGSSAIDDLKYDDLSPQSPKKDGYKFRGWSTVPVDDFSKDSTDDDIKINVEETPGGKFINESAQPDDYLYDYEDSELYAVWSKADYYYTLNVYRMNDNGEYGFPNSQKIPADPGDTVNLPSTVPVGDGFKYEIDRSKSDESVTVEADNSSELNVYYKRVYTYTFNAGETASFEDGGGTFVKDYDFGAVPDDPQGELLQSNSGKYFKGWDKEIPGQVTESLEFAAQWGDYRKATFVFDPAVEGATPHASITNVKPGDEIVLPAPEIPEGYQLQNEDEPWSFDGSDYPVGEIITAPDKDAEFVCKLIKTFKIEYYVDGELMNVSGVDIIAKGGDKYPLVNDSSFGGPSLNLLDPGRPEKNGAPQTPQTIEDPETGNATWYYDPACSQSQSVGADDTIPNDGSSGDTIKLYTKSWAAARFFMTPEQFNAIDETKPGADFNNPTVIMVQVNEPIVPPEAPTTVGHKPGCWVPEAGTMGNTGADFEFTDDEPDAFNATFMDAAPDKDPSEVVSLSIYYGDSIDVPDNPADPEGHYFDDWYDKQPDYTVDDHGLDAANTPDDYEGMPAEDLIFYANYLPEEYILKFDPNGGSPVDDITVTYGENMPAEPEKPNNPPKEGYTFKGWTQEAPETPQAPDWGESSCPDFGNDGDTVDFIADWEPETYTLKFDSNGGDPVDDISLIFGQNMPDKPVPAKPGFTAVEWYADEACTDRFTTWGAANKCPDYTPGAEGDAEIFLYAKWSWNYYTLNEYLMDENGEYDLTSSQKISADPGEPVYPPSTVPAGDGFKYEIDGSKSDESVTVEADNSSELNVYYKRVYTYTFNAGETASFEDGGGTFVKDYDFGAVPDDPQGKLLQSNSGKYFKGWDKEIPGQVTESLEFAAQWGDYRKATFVFDPAVEGATPHASITNVKPGDEIVLPAPEIPEGYQLQNEDEPWSYDGNNYPVGAIIQAPDKDAEFVCKLKEYHTITYLIPDNEAYKEHAKYDVDKGADIPTPDPPAPIDGFTFVKWALDDKGEVPVPDVMGGEDIIAYAFYSINTYTVTYLSHGEVYKEYTEVKYGSEVPRPDDPVPSDPSVEVFAGWTPAIPAEMPDYDLEFNAEWKSPRQYTAKFLVERGKTHALYVLDPGERIPIPEDPKRFGYKFAGWEPSVPATMPANDLVFTAKWEIDETFVAIVIGGTAIAGGAIAVVSGINAALITGAAIIGGVLVISQIAKRVHDVTYLTDGKVYKTYKVLEGQKIPVPDDPVKKGFKFVGWEPEVPERMGSEDLTFEAVWEKIPVDEQIPDTGSPSVGLAAFAAISSAAAAAYVIASKRKKED